MNYISSISGLIYTGCYELQLLNIVYIDITKVFLHFLLEMW